MTCAQTGRSASAGKDSDGDGLSDSDELKFFTNPFLADTTSMGSATAMRDSDMDDLKDGQEVTALSLSLVAVSSRGSAATVGRYHSTR